MGNRPGLKRFNEAGAIMPRSGTGYPYRLRCLLNGFNEAGAIMPRSGGRHPEETP